MAKRKNDLSRDSIITAAESLVSEIGANGFSLLDVSRKMGISKGTLYYYYPTKDGLLLDIIEKHMGELLNDFDEWLKRHQNIPITYSHFLDVVLYKGTKLFNRAKLHVYLVNECMRGNSNLESRYSELWHLWEKKLEDGIHQLFPEQKDAHNTAYALMLLIDGLCIQGAIGDSRKEKEDQLKDWLMERSKA